MKQVTTYTPIIIRTHTIHTRIRTYLKYIGTRYLVPVLGANILNILGTFCANGLTAAARVCVIFLRKDAEQIWGDEIINGFGKKKEKKEKKTYKCL